jgi:hypothetical protein
LICVASLSWSLNVGAINISMKHALGVTWIRPETRRSSRGQVEGARKSALEDRTLVCCIKLEWPAIWSERLNVSGDSWFSAKAILVAYFLYNFFCKALINVGGRLIGSFEISETHNGRILKIVNRLSARRF